jgi:hypothetical protein
MRRILAMTAQRGELSAKQTITAKKIIYELNKQSVLVLDNFSFYQSMELIVSDNEINLNQMYQSPISLLYLMHVSRSFAYCYHPVNVISLGLAQCDPFKRYLLYFYFNILIVPFPAST